MTPVPFDLPIRTGDAGKLATVLYEHAKRPLTEDLRNRLGIRASAAGLETIRPYLGSLERDPIHAEVFYLCIDGIDEVPLLMRFAPSSAPSSGLFPKAVLIGRLRVGSQETVINAVPFGPCDTERIRTFAWQLNPSFLPKVQGSKSSVSIPVRPGVFDDFRAIAKPLSLNLACVSGDLDAILWEAIRSGWREPYSAETWDAAQTGYSRYVLPAGADLASRLEQIARARVPLKIGRAFDWELQLDSADMPEETERLLEESMAAGKPAQFIGFADGRVPPYGEWLDIARRQGVGFSFSGLDDRPDLLRETARTLAGRFNYRAAAAADAREIVSALFG